MGWLDFIPGINSAIKDAGDVIKQVVVDKDKQNELLGKLESAGQQIEGELYSAELATKTIPWVDALHKMGRQILNLITILFIFTLLMLDKDISKEAMFVMGGGNVAYQLIKGKGGKK